MAKENLIKAKKSKKDEFYTQLVDIEKELEHYKEYFKDKIVFCNCDDPFESNFFKYFAMNFNYLGLKKLICTSYDNSPIAYSQLSFLEDVQATAIPNNNRKAYKIEISEVLDYNNDGAVDLADVEYLLKNDKNSLCLLKGNGDFRSDECIELLKECDIVVTNPPFSLFREYIAQLIEYDKKFIIIGNMNAITYKEIFTLIKKNKLWAGFGFNLSMIYKSVYDNTLEANKKFVKSKGFDPNDNYIKVPAVNWYTNLKIKKHYEELICYKKYTIDEYPEYDNYPAINVDKVSDIPYDYEGEMGVPITFIDKYNPEQFEIVGQGQGNLYRELTPKGLTKKFVDDYYKFGGKGSIKEDHPVLAYYDKNGKPVIPYMRIVIKRRKK
ncbi:MAG: adenine-specific methyltransferase EcoRI family protein [Clostridia bacterium]|nr:adenine-specific methyltransferase EcoRI family protein [Clostridia bacterium]